MKSAYNIVNNSDYAFDWFSGESEKSADYELIQGDSLKKLRISSRKFIKNEPIASGALKAYIDNIIGGKIRFEIDMKNKKNLNKFQAFLDETLNKIDVNRLKTLTQINETLIASAFTDGDVLINLPIDKETKKGIKTYVELVEASRIRTRPKDSKNPLVREGVAYRPDGKIKGYWVRAVLKNKEELYEKDLDSNYKFYPIFKKSGSVVRRICWLFSAQTAERPDQSRQVPVLTPNMELVRYYNKYLEAVLVNTRVAACFSAFVETSNPAEAKKGLEGTTDVKGKLVKLAPGRITYLRKGEKISFASPNNPSDNFDSFIVRLQKIYSMNLRLSYNQLFLDLKDANYSSWRAGSLSAERNINRWRNELTEINTWIVKTFLLEALTKNLLTGTLKGLKVKIRYPKYKSLDEEKTSRANRLKLQDGTISKKLIIDEEGNDYDVMKNELIEETQFEVELEKEKRLLQKEYSADLDILFEDNPANKKETETETEKGKDKDIESTEEEKERRKEDGNW